VWRDHKFAKVRADSACPIGAQNLEDVIGGTATASAKMREIGQSRWPVMRDS
jgi:hypothetical protein